MRILSSPVFKNYHTALVSSASLIYLISVVTLIVVPFWLAYSSNSFWLKEYSYREIPTVIFTKEAVLSARGAMGQLPLYIAWSTNDDYNMMRSLNYRNIVLKTFTFPNLVTKTKQFGFKLRIPTAPTDKIEHVAIAFQLQYGLRERFNFEMYSLAIVDIRIPTPLSSYTFESSLKLKVLNGLFNPKLTTNKKILNFTNIFGGDILDWNRIRSDYFNRAIRTDIEMNIPTFLPGSGSFLDIEGTIFIPEEKIFYRPGLLETLKYGFIQYLAFFIVCYTVWCSIWSFIVGKGLVYSFKKSK